MGRKQQPPRLATVTKIPTARRRGRPYKTLTSAVAVGRSATEREVLELLRRRLASRIDGGDDMPAAAFAAIVKQLRDVDAQIRALDAAAAAAVEEVSDEDDGDTGWDPSML
ncbi:MAG: hypothetical protein WA622_26990 [Mycobacterium sp.]|uniref:hypothetical protein n=1 Tax=Mycobacterium sp. TaxID=1785 RepID=UPI003C877AE9